MSFELLQQVIRYLLKLTYLTIQATGTLDLMNGQLWEEYLSKTIIKTFNFKFTLSNNFTCHQDRNSLLRSFSSSFWLEKRHWYVACEKGHLTSSRPTIYSVPYFQPPLLFYPSDNFLLATTADRDIVCKHATKLILTFHKAITLPVTLFTYVHSLTLLTSVLPPIEILQSIVDLKQIREIDVSLVENFSVDDFAVLVDYMTNLKIIKMHYNPLFVPPLHINYYTFVRKDKEMCVIDTNNIERFCYLFFHVRNLEITVRSKDTIIQLLNQLHYLEQIRIFCYQDCLLNIHSSWFPQNVPRLNRINFTYRITSSCLFLSIGDGKVSSLCIFLLSKQKEKH